MGPGLSVSADEAPQRVLVVDDDAMVAEVVMTYVQRAGFVEPHAVSGNDALNRVAAWAPDLVVLDPGRGRTRLSSASSTSAAVATPSTSPESSSRRWRATEARTPGPGACAGLGLAIVRGVAEAHGCNVDMHNDGPGCRFDLRIPVRV